MVVVLVPGSHRAWLANIDRQAVAPQALADIVRSQRITRDSFGILDAMEQITDPDGKSYFAIGCDTRPDDARRATLLTYILNAGTGYGGTRCDFAATPYGATEMHRIIERQWSNRWSYAAIRRVCDSGGRLVTTPNGMLMGLGGNRIHSHFSRRGGTTWGDLFMVSMNQVDDPAGRLRAIIETGRAHPDGPGLDRLLHHEEIHAQQWAEFGPVQLPARYLAEETRVRIFGGTNRFEKQAGLSDGEYC
ncbi:hypothetical protein [[Mycobacterium] vasticus]|uniref:Uncharacterized protein n=1 Tax=[Mycobacterium] vasticus TaxID=2875777 RepID=A0ABU5YRP2_9MYCO|nr:hypothetical protein [Mycolicibacter sp. MYC017]MEB3067627.1 hypothetical protein [Mycolicibacter sp. MYC017]